MSLLIYPPRLPVIPPSPPPIVISKAPGPIVSMFYSDNGGITWKHSADRNLGNLGSYGARLIWTNLGSSRYRVYRFQTSDPSPLFSVDLTAEIKGGKF